MEAHKNEGAKELENQDERAPSADAGSRSEERPGKGGSDDRRERTASASPAPPPSSEEAPKKEAYKGEQKSGSQARASKRKNNVRKLRTERMMSKAELARRAGLSVLTVDRVERGMPCRMDTKRKILEALGLRPQDRVMVFGDTEED